MSMSILNLFRNADGDVVKATKTTAAGLAVKNDFPVFMAVMDVAWLAIQYTTILA